MKVAPFALERWMSRWEMDVEFDIAESGVYPLTTRELIALLPEAEQQPTIDTLLDLRLGYTEARGTEALRTTLASVYEGTTAENILVTTGAIEANYLVFNTLLAPGDHVVAVYPAYQQLYAVAEAIGCDVSRWELREANGFRYDIDELKRLLRPNTKLVVVNTPHNPTGSLLTPAELDEIYALTGEAGARLLCDEAYRWLDLPGQPAMAPPIRNKGGHGISVGTMSKPFGLPGLRIGWIAADEELVQQCWGSRDYISLSPAKLSDALTQIAIHNRDAIVARNHQIMQENLVVAEQWFAANADLVSWTPPRAGLLALLKYKLDVPSMELANLLAGEYSVMLAPGSAFGFEGYLRIGIGQRPDLFREGLFRTAAALRDLQTKQR
ncbi:MAG TPA: aminotransferase class I/II-fold pyridoxal phosphate-dependent enzyme [Thermomicrobiales bacterium]|nr:aminotransferase class I/II-fold pyridoxal phosphate-dependent enzyme [Thermomicrobiales bacterium]